ncbi:type I restriction enzyme HsdR N-terminal domain-containing protein [Bacillus thuringiensis]|uniref:type I restriction enzyme HsdR N-terminal domain-containing protein n=1 Tax=Bacillus thuringiensis TaxID=1428 RepID=UPI000BFC859C|nr:type I restriction enzyme HsdR N-terminal domain-containing protein [Bacillus thuringiensis]PGT57942.1 hypothetical protein COD16_22430 [Bacillus thuringiensis]
MVMKEADILKGILYPIILQAGYEKDEIALDYFIKSNIGGGEIRLRPDIVLFDEKTPLLVIELKHSLSTDKQNKAMEQALFYSNEIGLPIFAITDGISFYLYSSDKSMVTKIDSIEGAKQKLEFLLSKESLKGLIGNIQEDTGKFTSIIELERKWLTQIDEEVLFLDDGQNELKYIGAKVVSYLGERVFEKFCVQEGIPYKNINLVSSFDFMVGTEKVEVKATLVNNKSKAYKFRYHQKNTATTIICVVIYGDLDDEALLGYNFTQAEVVGFARTDELKNKTSVAPIIKQSDLLPINKWIEGIKGGISR